ncbi:unnamed protein product [Microthlaspi erraticum]|uniref:Uncharacterized protein n=1 Tax=Microthlaspi erraticum TaxID=1685480 RepID=A0A6D2KZE3_9BRAS|nr:unnamed protein product [Microthlaspi erraticum]
MRDGGVHTMVCGSNDDKGKGRLNILTDGACIISDGRSFRIWGKPVYGGIGTVVVGHFPGSSFFSWLQNKKGESCTGLFAIEGDEEVPGRA